MPSTATITVLVENSVDRSGLMAEHGLAFWVDTGARCILFDAGQGHLIMANARELKVDLDAVDAIVLSHGHYDHTGGISDVLANATGDVAVYSHPAALLPKFRKSDKSTRSIGIPSHCVEVLQSECVNLQTLIAPLEIAPGIMLTGEIPRKYHEEENNEGFCLDEDGHQVDGLIDDQALYLQTPTGTVVLLGCAHSGVINTLAYIQSLTKGQPFLAVIGGMHLHTAMDKRIAWTVEALRSFHIERFYPAHCTGSRASAALWTAFPGQCYSCGVGNTMSF